MRIKFYKKCFVIINKEKEKKPAFFSFKNNLLDDFIFSLEEKEQKGYIIYKKCNMLIMSSDHEIIASTYMDDNYPNIPMAFIQDYIENYNNGIDIKHIEIEYEEKSYNDFCDHDQNAGYKQGYRFFCIECNKYLDSIKGYFPILTNNFINLKR